MANRRQFIRNSSLLLIASQTPLLHAADDEFLTPWKPGMLDIHHISTGRGNSSFLILPDGTTMMVDAGAIYGRTEYLIAPKPDGSRRPGEWIGRYVKRQLDPAGLQQIDAFLLTHLHGDHMGYLTADLPLSPDRSYKLTGVSDVAAIVPIQKFVDRAWPDYNDPLPATADFQNNYRMFLQAQAKAGRAIERFKVGSNRQFRLVRAPKQYPSFEIRNLISNGEVWTGKDEQTRKLFPDLTGMRDADMPSENACSAAIRLQYGKFRYYTGGDLTSDTNYGRDPWRDTETPAAAVCGPVSVAVANHHGYFNATGADFVRALKPRVFVILAWDSAHPTVNTLATMYSKAIYPGDRDVFATAVKPELKITNKRVADFKSSNGHVVVRVEEGGERFRIAVVSNADESGRVIGQFGPYLC
jgi:beta-lactamase superfamily II metal-dependent hydrolase